MIVWSSCSSGESVSVFWTLGPTLLHTTTQRLLPESGRGFFSFQHYWCQKFKDPKPSSKGWKRFCFPFDRNHHCISHTSTLLRSKIQRPNALFQKVEEVLFSFHQESSLYFIHINITDVKNSKTQRLLQKSGRGFVFVFNRNHHCISHTSTLLLSKIQRPNAFLQKSERGFVSDRNVILSRWHIGEPLNGIYKKS